MKLAIIGSRTCPPVDIEAYLRYIPDTIVSGGAKGADTYAREFAQKKGLKLIEYFPNYDKYGKGATLMVIGSILLTIVHGIFAIPALTSVVIAIAAMILLGIAFGLVPSAMWPSVPKIIPMQLLGTAYAVIFYIQNIGLALVPVMIGKVNQANTDANDVTDYTTSMTIFAICGVISIVIALMLKFEDKKKGYGLEQANIKKN